MKHLIPLAFVTLALTACVDTTGLSAESSRPVHPSTNENAAVVVAEYADFECPACRDAYTRLVGPMIQKYGKNIRYEYHQFPLSSIHRYAMEASEASECAADQGKFWEFVDIAFERQESLNSKAITTWAQELELDMDTFGRCLDSHIKRDTVRAEYDAGRALGVTGTPTFFVNGQRVESSTDALFKAIDTATVNAGKNL